MNPSGYQELIKEVKETGWEGGGHHPAKLTRAEVKVLTMYFTSDSRLFKIFWKDTSFSAK